MRKEMGGLKEENGCSDAAFMQLQPRVGETSLLRI